MGYDFSIEYEKEMEKKAVDTFSKRDEEMDEYSCSAMISFPTLSWLVELRQSYDNSIELAELLNNLKTNQEVLKDFSS